MTINMSPYYVNLRNEVLTRCNRCSREELGRLKDTFKNQIRSNRRLDCITTVADLISILEKRNVLNSRDLTCFKSIASILNHRDLVQFIESGVHRVISTPPTINVVPSPPLPSQHQHQHLLQRAPVLNLQRLPQRERIFELIINEIGLKWKDLARSLRIGEGKIDELEERHRFAPSERVREILLYYERNAPEDWFPLLDALRQSRRSDLCNEVQRILASH